MGRRTTGKSGAAFAASGGAAAVGSAAGVPAVGWDELLARAEAALDEQGLERRAKWEKTAGRYLALLGRRGIEPKWNVGGVKRALAAYFCDMVLGEGRPRGMRRVFAEEGVVLTDMWDSMNAHPEIRLVYEYMRRQVKMAAEASAQDLVRQAQHSQERLVTEDGCELNQRAVELSLRATMKDVYGDGDGGGGGGGDAKKGISYSFPNMTVNWIVAPQELRKGAKAAEPEVIDVGP